MTRACVSVASPGSFSCGSMERGKQGREDLLTAWRKKKEETGEEEHRRK